MSNRLSKSKSPYLRKAQDQPVDWYEWGDEAFARARELDRPVLLSVGGVWCHWCHVMAHESFEDAEIAALINAHYVAVKVDRDERPDIDRRYQDAVIKITGSGGWPLTAFLTPEGKFFYGGTYFPPEDGMGRPGFRTLLSKIAEFYRNDKKRIEEVAAELYHNTATDAEAGTKSDISAELIRQGVSGIMPALDTRYGGLGNAPKFHHASAFEFLINYEFFSGDESIRKSIVTALDGMAAGGIYDHLLGGFFRYSTDERWLVPHFEKMLYDNAELMKLYAIAHRVFGKGLYLSVVQGIEDYYKRYGCDEEGGFYASQDADIGVLDEGGYYTFSSEDLTSILAPEEFKAASLYFGIDTAGRMHHDPARNVLFIDKRPESIAEIMHLQVAQAEEVIRSAKEKMLNYREQARKMPFIDKTIYTNWNGLMIEALCTAGNLSGSSEYIEMAEKTANRILGEYYAGGRLMHAGGVAGFAEDYIFFAQGLIELYQSVQQERYLQIAAELMDGAIKLFWDDENGGFFDAERGGPGYLGIGMKNIHDSPVRSANGAAPLVLMLLSVATGRTHYAGYAEKNLKAFAGLAEGYSAFSHSYLISLHAFLTGIYKVETSEFFEQALRHFRPYKFVIKKEIEGVLVCEKNSCCRYDEYPAAGP
ncbi:MAG TPA: thioredoxin domain-containing protein, partial [Dissulfurispiraceae bacterium]|nr:thioredoxin domain-containing protein [Dissulfurispiraceae bacterium]